MKKFFYMFLIAIIVTLFNAYMQKANAEQMSRERRLKICRQSAEIYNKTAPHRVDSVTWVMNARCVLIKDRVRFTSTYKLEVAKKDLPEGFLVDMEKQYREGVCPNLRVRKDVLEMYDLGVEYMDESGSYIGTVSVTEKHCR